MTITARHGLGALDLRGVRRDFGTVVALAGIDLQVQEGEFLALLGPSGCGKSTALSCIAGLLPLTAGSIHLGTRRIDGLKPEDRGFGLVFQSFALFPHMDVRRNVGFGLDMMGVGGREARRRVDEALALVRLQAEADRYPGELSGGQQQRVAIARAVVIEPALVLMDEPLSNLDTQLRLEMRAEIRRIHDAIGSTTIYVTHDQDEALSMADRVAVMRAGTLRQVGSPADVYERPADPDVAEFMGFRNRLTGRVAAVAGASVEVEACGVRIVGTAREGAKAGDLATVCVRPDDLARSGGPDGAAFSARVAAVEYRGHALFGSARAEDGTELFFRADRPLRSGESIRLAAPPGRVLVFPDAPATAGPGPRR